MSYRTTYKPGDWNIVCDRCGFKIKRSEAMETWDNLLVCKKDWEPRQPQEYMVRGVKDKQSVPMARPDPGNVFIDESVRPEEVDL